MSGYEQWELDIIADNAAAQDYADECNRRLAAEYEAECNRRFAAECAESDPPPTPTAARPRSVREC